VISQDLYTFWMMKRSGLTLGL